MRFETTAILKAVCFLLATVIVSQSDRVNVPIEAALEAKRTALEAAIGFSVDIVTFNDTAGRQSARILWVKPTSVRQIQRLVRGAKNLDLKLRVVGAAHSWSPLFPEHSQIGVSLNELRGKKYTLNQARDKITVLSSVRIGDAQQWAAERGLSFGPVPVAAVFTIPGVTATGSHGTSARFGPFANMVYGYELVDGNGRVRKLNEHTDKEIIDACRVHLGMCGIIYKTIVKVFPDVKQKFTVASIPIQKLLVNENRRDLVMNNWGAFFGFFFSFQSATEEERAKMMADPLRRIPDTYDIFKENMVVWLWRDVAQTTPLREEFADTVTLADGSTFDAVSVIAPFSQTSYGQYVHSRDQCEQLRSDISFAAPESDDFTESGKTMTNHLKVLEGIFKNVGFYSHLIGFSAIRWMKHFDDCLLCTTKVADRSSRNKLVTYTETFTQFDQCADPIISDANSTKQMLIEVEFGVGTMRNNSKVLSHWAKNYLHVPGTTDQIRRQHGDDLLTFINWRNKYNLDSDNIFVNDYLKDIFRDAFAKTCAIGYSPFMNSHRREFPKLPRWF